MRFALIIIATASAYGAWAQESTCNYVTLVKCFIDILDDWAWTLYELKDNVVTINQEQCQHLRRLERCVKDDIEIGSLAGIPEEKTKHSCKPEEIVEVSNTVSDLLTHRKKSGSFLKSYYLLTYACSAEGQAILREHRECLKAEAIGQMTLSAGTYLSEKFLEHAEDEVCDHVNQQLDQYMLSTRKLCREEAAARLMCKSLIEMFRGLHSDKLESCELQCNIPKLDDEQQQESNALPEGETTQQVANDQEALNHAKAGSTLSQLFSFATAAVMLLVR